MQTYKEQWDDYKRRIRILWIVWLTYVPGASILGLSLAWLFDSDTPVYVVGISWFLACVFSKQYVQAWLCPRCGDEYCSRWWYTNIHARYCVYCGLPKWGGGV